MGDMHHWFCLLSVILILFRNVKCLHSDHGGGALWSATWQSSTGAFNLINISSRSWDKIHAQEFSLLTYKSKEPILRSLWNNSLRTWDVCESVLLSTKLLFIFQHGWFNVVTALLIKYCIQIVISLIFPSIRPIVAYLSHRKGRKRGDTTSYLMHLYQWQSGKALSVCSCIFWGTWLCKASVWLSLREWCEVTSPGLAFGSLHYFHLSPLKIRPREPGNDFGREKRGENMCWHSHMRLWVSLPAEAREELPVRHCVHTERLEKSWWLLRQNSRP